MNISSSFQINPKTGVIDYHGNKEWCILKLGLPGKALEIEVDTNHFKGNFPESFWVEGRSINDKDGQFSVKLLGKIFNH